MPRSRGRWRVGSLCPPFPHVVRGAPSLECSRVPTLRSLSLSPTASGVQARMRRRSAESSRSLRLMAGSSSRARRWTCSSAGVTSCPTRRQSARRAQSRLCSRSAPLSSRPSLRRTHSGTVPQPRARHCLRAATSVCTRWAGVASSLRMARLPRSPDDAKSRSSSRKPSRRSSATAGRQCRRPSAMPRPRRTVPTACAIYPTRGLRAARKRSSSG